MKAPDKIYMPNEDMTREEEICTGCGEHGNCPYELRNLQRKCNLFDYLNLADAAMKLVDAVEQYVEPRPGDKYMHRTKVLAIKNELKEILK